MSYIRFGQEGRYVDIPEGSQYYLYGNGNDINGWEYEEFAGILSECIPFVCEDDEEAADMRKALREKFGGIDGDYSGSVAEPETAEIMLQVLDSRTDVIEVDDDLIERFEEWVESNGPYTVECDNCGDPIRPYLDMDGKHFCSKKECEIAMDAEMLGISFEEAEELDQIDDPEEYNERAEELMEE